MCVNVARPATQSPEQMGPFQFATDDRCELSRRVIRLKSILTVQISETRQSVLPPSVAQHA